MLFLTADQKQQCVYVCEELRLIASCRQTGNSAYCCGDLRRLRENLGRLHPKFLPTKELAAASRQRIVPHLNFHQGIFFTKNNMTVGPHPTYISLFPRPKIKLKGRLF
jgi:hypothetical protein